MRFVHTADWQLGMTRYFLNGEAQPRYSAARRDVVAGIGPLAVDAGAEFVVVAGDVFEDNQLAPRDVSQSLEAMRAIGIPVYLLPGNHDPLDAASVYTSALFTAECPDNVTVLDRAGVHEVRPGLQIVAAPWRSKKPTSDLVAEVLDGDPHPRDPGANPHRRARELRRPALRRDARRGDRGDQQRRVTLRTGHRDPVGDRPRAGDVVAGAGPGHRGWQ